MVTTHVSAAQTPIAETGARPPISFSEKAKGYLALTKPRVVELLLVTTLPTMFYAHSFAGNSGVPSLWLMVATMVGGALAAGASGAFNCYIDRDIDKVMNRTSKRPLVTGVITPREALVFSWVLTVIAVVLLWSINPLTGMLGIGAIVMYVVVYSLILKRRTTQNIVWGGAAGCFPVLIAWAAVTNTIQWPAVILFMIIFLWTPPHYWPLSMRYSDDYNAVNVPMLGAVAGSRTVAVQVVLYTWAMVACSLLMIPLGGAGIVYTVVAAGAGAWFLYEAHVLYNNSKKDLVTKKNAMKVFHASITYLTLVFLSLAVDPFVGSALMG
ncbi:protoheme IX farnesyltransferase [Arthrobacter stackebrandtii]|nr:protoheme IX farnesyltransferase [Arthrobacter stackebrandtii]